MNVTRIESLNGVKEMADSADRHVSPGRTNVSEQALPGRHPATVHNNHASTRDRKRWTHDENILLYELYIRSKPSTRGYRQRLAKAWVEKTNERVSEQNLSDRVRMINKKHWLTDMEKECIQRRIQDAVPENNSDSSMTDNNTEIEPDPQNPRSSNLTDFLEEIIDPLPNLKNTPAHLLSKAINQVDQDLGAMRAENIDEFVQLIKIGISRTAKLLDYKTPKSRSANKPPWCKRLEGKIKTLRQHVNKLTALHNGTSPSLDDTISKKYDITRLGTSHALEIAKQRLKATAEKLKRFKNRCDRYVINSMFKTGQGQVYRKLKNDSTTTCTYDSSDLEPMETFWSSIWSVNKDHNESADWVTKLEHHTPVTQSPLVITAAKLRTQLNKMPNWKAPGPDGIRTFWLKRFHSTHDNLADLLNQCLVAKTTPPSLTKGRTILIQKDPRKGKAPNNYRPITCLSTIYKTLTGIVASYVYDYLHKEKLIPLEQKGCHKATQGCKDHLLLDKTVTKHCRSKKRNLHMAWIDYKKAYDMVPHSWIIKSLQLCGVHTNITNWIDNTMRTWQTDLYIQETHISNIKVKRGIFQGDSLSPLLFIIALFPLTKLINKTDKGYNLSTKARVSHLLYMDDIKLYGRSEKEITSLINTVQGFSSDIGMEFGLQKCAQVAIKRGVIDDRNSDITTLTGDKISSVFLDEPYKYLGVLQTSTIHNTEIKDGVTKEYLTRMRQVLKSNLNGTNATKAINTYAIPTIRYTAGIIKWTKEEMDQLDRDTRKVLTKYGAHNPNADVDRLYANRNDGGRGLTPVRDTILNEEQRLMQTISKRQDWISKAIMAENTLEAEPYTKVNYKENWRKKKMHGQYIRETEDITSKETWDWLNTAELKRETEATIVAAQDQAITTKYTRAKIYGTNDDPMCRLCNQKPETINHIVGECPKIALTAYKKRHDKVATALHWDICRQHNIPTSKAWYNHVPMKVTENDEVKILWDYDIQTDKHIQARRPDITIESKQDKSLLIVDVAIPVDHNIKDKENEKITKYQDLRHELKKIWKLKKAEVVPIVVGALGAIPKDLEKHLKKIANTITIRGIQKTAILETAGIIRRTLNFDPG